MNSDGYKATPNIDISINILKLTVDIHLPYKTNIINLPIEGGLFFSALKLAEVSPIFPKKDDLDKENYRPATVLPHVLKVFARTTYHQINDFMTDKLSKELAGFRKNHTMQHCLISMLETWKKILDHG